MSRRLPYMLLLLTAFLLLLIAPVHAQDGSDVDTDTPSPLLALLDRVPAQFAPLDEPLQLDFIDFAALYALAPELPPGVPSLETFDDLSALESLDGKLYQSWFSVVNRQATGSAELRMAFGYGDMRAANGFGYFEVTQALVIGMPPTQITYYAGDFDLDAVREALAARDYESVDRDGVETLCWTEGCDRGLETDLPSRDPANVFGADLGRRFPVALTASDDGTPLLMTSAGIGAVDLAASMGGEDAPNPLGQRTDIRRLVDAMTTADYDALIQVQFLSPLETTLASVMDITTGEIIDPADEAFGVLPVYLMAAIYDAQVGEEQVAGLAAVYADEATAQAAVDVMAARLDAWAPMAQRLDELPATLSTRVLAPDDGGIGTVAVLEIRYPNPDLNDPDAFMVPTGGNVYLMLVQARYQRDLQPLILALTD